MFGGCKKFIYLILCIPLLLGGCITSSYHKSNEEYRSARREFNPVPETSYRVVKGICTGKREMDGETYYHLQFQALLKGDGRYLDVMIPVKPRMVNTSEVGPDGNLRDTGRLMKSPGAVLFRESVTAAAGGTPVYLVFRVSMDNRRDFQDLFMDQQTGKAGDPGALFQRNNYLLKEAQYPLVLAVLDFSNIFTYSANAIVWEKGADGKPFVACTGLDYGPYDAAGLGIAWKERSRMIYLLRHGGYAGTVIADVVTSPVQLVMYILTALSGPGVR